MSELVDLYGPEIVFHNCIIGENLNLGVIRGFARLDELAAISAPDVYDEHINSQGTQRELKPKHAKEATSYAMESTTLPPDSDPRAFTEVILNARDRSVVSIFASIEGGSQELDFTSTDVVKDLSEVVSVKVNLRQLSWPRPHFNPQISRVDGNHRLSGVDLPESGEDRDYPVVPFALFVALTTDQERSIFRDINGTQEKMETSHLATILLKLQGLELLKTESGRALWMAQQLCMPGQPFEGKVFFGGSTKGAKERYGAVPPLKISTLKTAIQTTMRDAASLDAEYFNQTDEDGMPIDPKESDAREVLALLSKFWTAVSRAYPQAWQDRSNYILLQAIGLAAFSKLGADVIQRQFFEEGDVKQSSFDTVLAAVASQVPLDKSQFTGIAGLAGARVVYQRLALAMNSDVIKIKKAKDQLAQEVGVAGPLDDD